MWTGPPDLRVPRQCRKNRSQSLRPEHEWTGGFLRKNRLETPTPPGTRPLLELPEKNETPSSLLSFGCAPLTLSLRKETDVWYRDQSFVWCPSLPTLSYTFLVLVSGGPDTYCNSLVRTQSRFSDPKFHHNRNRSKKTCFPRSSNRQCSHFRRREETPSVIWVSTEQVIGDQCTRWLVYFTPIRFSSTRSLHFNCDLKFLNRTFLILSSNCKTNIGNV